MNQRAEELKRKALLYERAASMATDPDACRAYLDLARQLQTGRRMPRLPIREQGLSFRDRCKHRLLEWPGSRVANQTKEVRNGGRRCF